MEFEASTLRRQLLDRTDVDDHLVEKALQRASEAHAGALRDEGTPYECHPMRVALILTEELGIGDPDLVCAALLHDILEDDPSATYEEIRGTFGLKVAQLVLCLTDEFRHSGLARPRRRELYLRRIAGADDECLIVKLCDRLDNLRSLPFSPDREKRSLMAFETREYLLPVLKDRPGVFPRLATLLNEALRSL